MSEPAGGTNWTERDSETFLDRGRYYVPQRDAQIATICAAIPDPAGPAHIVELCCGEGLLAQALLERFATATVHALDGSDAMLAATARRLASFGGRFETAKFDLPARDWRRFPWPIHAVVSSLAIHHLSAAEKQALYADMAACLAPGGTLVVCDLVEAPTPRAAASLQRLGTRRCVAQRSRWTATFPPSTASAPTTGTSTR